MTQRQSKNTRAISILFIYILFLNEIVSFSYANSLMNTKRQFNTSNYIISESSQEYSHFVKSNSVEVNKLAKKTLNSGPGQSENNGFSVSSTDGMVDKFTGDFSYSIPLMDVEGYPISLKYNSNVSLNTEAAWVGLGWDLSIGSVSREMRGIPDEFNGNQSIKRIFNEKQDRTYDGYKAGGFIGVGPNKKNVFLPTIQITSLWGSYKNSYLGLGKTFDFGLQSKFSISSKDNDLTLGIKFGKFYSRDTKNGIGINNSFGVSAGASTEPQGLGKSISVGVTFGNSFNTRSGLISKSFSWEAGGGNLKEVKDGSSTTYKGFSAEGGASSTVMYGTQTSLPRISISSKGSSFQQSYSASVGTKKNDNYVLLGGLIVNLNHYENELELSDHTVDQPAFGFFHSGKRADYSREGTYPIMDFNRTSESEYSDKMSNLSFSIQTYDVFYANAMGISSTFRARRNDFGSYYDPMTTTKINDDNKLDQVEISAGFMFAKAGNKISFGTSTGFMKGNAESGNLLNINGTNVLEFNKESQSDEFDESVYFKSVGENTPESMKAYEALNNSTADCFKLTKTSDNTLEVTNNLINKNTTISSSTINTLNTNDIKRPYTATYYNVKTGADFDINDGYYSYSYNSTDLTADKIDRIKKSTNSFVGKDPNLISAVEVVNTDGTKYNYGIPVYSVVNKEISFGATGLTEISGQPGIIHYTPGVDNYISNSRGWSNYYDKTETPAYAHTFLLTEMLSSDYIDLQGDGLTVDDAGTYYKFNYTQFFSYDSPFKWRYPFSGGQQPEAMLAKGMLGSSRDDMAHYTYGEKEIWYAHSIESKNLIAVFKLKNRDDGFAITNENGEISTNKQLQALDKIILYNRADFITNPATAKPLQTIEFEYDYSLCKKNPTNKYTYLPNLNYAKSGKLTLKKIRIYNGNSKELGLSTYSFEYNAVTNPDFRYCDVDGWGNYKHNNISKPNELYPYANQDLSSANININSYKLVAINNPSGGRTEIKYEADRYGFVQNKKVMSHIDIAGMTTLFDLLAFNNSNSWDGTLSQNFTTSLSENQILSRLNSTNNNELRSKLFIVNGCPYISKVGVIDKKIIPNNVIIFKLENAIPNSVNKLDADNLIRDNYFKDVTNSNNSELTKLMFKLRVNIKSGVDEFVPCFVNISSGQKNIFENVPNSNFNDDLKSFGVMPILNNSTSYEYGYVVLDPENSANLVDIKNSIAKAIHPLQRFLFDFARQNLPDILYGNCDGCTPDLSIDKAVNGGDNIYDYMLYNQNLVTNISAGSTLRLYDGDGIKIGGNARVSKITYFDNWSTISGEYDSKYEWNYEYENSVGRTLKTNGVASYETRTIKDENPFYDWNVYYNIKKEFPDEAKFTAVPIADALFPIPVIGYSEVKVKFLNGTKGYSTSSFFTAKDYPTFYDQTTIDNSISIRKANLLSGKTIDVFGFSQGYSVNTNDFHGKPKETKLYNNLNEVQFRTSFQYYCLGVKLPMIDRTTNLTDENVALEYDIHADSRFITNETKFKQFGINLLWTIPSFIPVPGIIYFQTSRLSAFYSNTLIKHLNRSAILKSVETENIGSINTAENLVYDKYTGNTILSSLTDEFNEPLYSMNYPSHWFYDNLRDLGTVLRTSFTGVIANGVLTLNNVNNIDALAEFSPGDILQVNNGELNDAWVYKINKVGNSYKLVLIDAFGAAYNSSEATLFRIKKSNRDNRLNETMQNVVTKVKPTSSTLFTFPSTNIISASAVSYTTRKNINCEMNNSRDLTVLSPGTVFNPFLKGILGDLVIDRQYAWQDERVDLTTNKVRYSGYYNSFSPFYFYNPSAQTKLWNSILPGSQNSIIYYDLNYSTDDFFHSNWRLLNKTILFDQFAKPIESIDQIGLSSSVLYGYNSYLDIIPVAQIVNSSQQDVAFDGFEDYSYYSQFQNQNLESHFDFKSALNSNVILQSTERHTGLKALKIAPNSFALVNKKVGNIDCYPISSGDPVSRTAAYGSSSSSSGNTGFSYSVTSCACIKPFEPRPNDYIVSVWVKEDNNLTKENYLSSGVQVSFSDYGGQVVNTINFVPKGNIIDGWQRLEGSFTIPYGVSKISVKLINNSTSTNSYFDDFRIHPFLAGLTTVVYDPNTLLPMATHDGYNYSTYFNYDENLNQVRVKVETINGIQTISEGEFGGQKSFK